MEDPTSPAGIVEPPKRRGRGRPPHSPEQRAAKLAARREHKAEQQRKRRQDIRAERDRIANILARPAVLEKRRVREPGKSPEFVPTAEDRARVTTYAGLGTPHDAIALLVFDPATGTPISERTLREAFEVELGQGPARANSSVAESLYKMATGTGGVKRIPAAAIFWLKARAGWRETVNIEADIRAGVLVAPAGVSPEEWIAAARKVDVEKLEPGGSERAIA